MCTRTGSSGQLSVFGSCESLQRDGPRLPGTEYGLSKSTNLHGCVTSVVRGAMDFSRTSSYDLAVGFRGLSWRRNNAVGRNGSGFTVARCSINLGTWAKQA